MTKTYYDVLGVPESADQDAVERAWRERVKETHPDQNDDPNAEQQFLNVKEAYDVLSDPEERERYDRLGHDQYLGRGAGTGSTDEATENAYSRDDASSSADASDDRTASGVNWTANTRGSEAAERAWSDPTSAAQSASVADDAPARVVQLAAYAVVAVPLGIASPIFLSSLLGPVLGGDAPVTSGPAAVAVVAVVALVFVGTVTAAERLLDTERRLLDHVPAV